MKPVPEDRKLGLLVSEANRLGATEAKVIRAEDVVVDKRVRLKCAVPVCAEYGRHLLCPPNLMSVEEFSEILRLYRKALVLQVVADADSTDKSSQPLDAALSRRIERTTETSKWERKLHRVVSEVEALAFKNGFYLAAGLIGGNCCLCPECVGPGGGQLCRHPFDARPSMEAMGIDVVRTCHNVGLPLELSSRERVRWTGLVLLE